MELYNCKNKCCKFKIKPYINNNQNISFHNNKKAGIFIYDPKTTQVLLVQSRGNLWGFPKGTIKNMESPIDCAIREVKEETGLHININNIKNYTNVHNNGIYYFCEIKSKELEIQDHKDNDANGIGWIKINCLQDCIYNGNIDINKHTEIVLERFLKIKISKSDFIKI